MLENLPDFAHRIVLMKKGFIYSGK